MLNGFLRGFSRKKSLNFSVYGIISSNENVVLRINIDPSQNKLKAVLSPRRNAVGRIDFRTKRPSKEQTLI